MIFSGNCGPHRKVAAVQPTRVVQSPVPYSRTLEGTHVRENDVFLSPQGSICKKISLNINGVVKDLIVPIQQGVSVQTAYDTMQSDYDEALRQGPPPLHGINTHTTPLTDDRFQSNIITGNQSVLQPTLLNVDNTIRHVQLQHANAMIKPELLNVNNVLEHNICNPDTMFRPHSHTMELASNKSNFVNNFNALPHQNQTNSVGGYQFIVDNNPGIENGAHRHNAEHNLHNFNMVGYVANSSEVKNHDQPKDEYHSTSNIFPTLPSRNVILLPHSLTTNTLSTPSLSAHGVSSILPNLHGQTPLYSLTHEIPYQYNAHTKYPATTNTRLSDFEIPANPSVKSSQNVHFPDTTQINSNLNLDDFSKMTNTNKGNSGKKRYRDFIVNNDRTNKTNIEKGIMKSASCPTLNIRAKCTLSAAVHRQLLNDTNAGKIVLVHFNNGNKKEKQVFLFEKVSGCLQSSIQNIEDLRYLSIESKQVVEYKALNSQMIGGVSSGQILDIHTLENTVESSNEYMKDSLSSFGEISAVLETEIKSENLSENIKIQSVRSISESNLVDTMDHEANNNNVSELYSESIKKNRRKYTYTARILSKGKNKCDKTNKKTKQGTSKKQCSNITKKALKSKIKTKHHQSKLKSDQNMKTFTQYPKVKQCSVAMKRLNVDYEQYRNQGKIYIARKSTTKLPKSTKVINKTENESRVGKSTPNEYDKDTTQPIVDQQKMTMPVVFASNFSFEAGARGLLEVPINKDSQYIMVKTLAGTFLVPTNKEQLNSNALELFHDSDAQILEVDHNNNRIRGCSVEENIRTEKNELTEALNNNIDHFDSSCIEETKKKINKSRIKSLKEKQKLQHLATQEAKRTLDSLKYTLDNVGLE